MDMTTTKPTGADLDAAIAEALGWKTKWEADPFGDRRAYFDDPEIEGPVPRWSILGASAVKLLTEMEQRGFGWYMSHGTEMPSYTAVFQKRDPAQPGRLLSWDYTADTLPLAIARAALAALRAEKETNAR